MSTGINVLLDINDLIANMILESSPPDATFEMLRASCPILAVNRKLTLFLPVSVKSFVFSNITSMLASGIPSSDKDVLVVAQWAQWQPSFLLIIARLFFEFCFNPLYFFFFQINLIFQRIVRIEFIR
jgi:hypothetical protein